MLKKLLSLLMCLTLLLSAMAARAEETPTVRALEGSAVAIPVCQDENAAQVLTAIAIMGLDEPVTGDRLEDEARAVSAEGVE